MVLITSNIRKNLFNRGLEYFVTVYDAYFYSFEEEMIKTLIRFT